MKKLFALTAAALIAASATYAEESTLELGDFSNAEDYFEGGTPEENGFPFNYQYIFSGGQVIYPYEQLKEIADRNGEVKAITFRYKENGTFYDGNFEGTSTIWAQATDLASIPVNDKKKSIWQTYASGSQATASIDYEITYFENYFDVTYTFATPVKLASGQGLQITAASHVTNAMAANSDDFYCMAYHVNPADNNQFFTTFYGSDKTSFQDACTPGEEYPRNSRWAPVAKIDYTYIDKLPQAQAPVFSPESGTALGPDDTVSISAQEGAAILYTLEKDGTPQTPYEGPIAIDKNCTVTAIATLEGHDPSEPVSASYTLKTAPEPSFVTPETVLLGANEKVIISSAEGTTLLYTLEEGKTPDTAYPEEGITLPEGETKVFAMATETGAYPSEIVAATYTVSPLDAILIGDYNAIPTDDNTFIGTNWYNAPIIPTYANSASQMLYLDSEMPGRTDKTRLKAISFRFINETCFTEYHSTARLYLALTDDTDFPYDNLNRKYRWFGTDLEQPAFTMPVDIDFTDYYFLSGELTFDLGEEGFDIPQGKSLIITVVNEAPTPLDNSEYPQFMKYNTSDRRTATFASDRTTFAESLSKSDYVESADGYYDSMTDYNQPCVKIFTDEEGLGDVSVNGITVGNKIEDTEYYTIQGIRLSSAPAERGIYIRRSAAGTDKIIVR